MMTVEHFPDGQIGLNIWDGEQFWERHIFPTEEELEIYIWSIRDRS